MDQVLLKGAILAEMCENALMKMCFEEGKSPEEFEDSLYLILERATRNTEIELCEGAEIEVQREIFMLIREFQDTKNASEIDKDTYIINTGDIKKNIQAIYAKYNSNKNDLLKALDKVQDGVEKTKEATEKVKEIYNEAKPTVNAIIAVINLLKIFFKK